MKNTNCPYCDCGIELDIMDGCEDDEIYQSQCPECKKYFSYTVSASVDYSPQKADCLNGGRHNFQQRIGLPKEHFIGRFICWDCGQEEYRDEEGRKKALKEMLNN